MTKRFSACFALVILASACTPPAKSGDTTKADAQAASSAIASQKASSSSASDAKVAAPPTDEIKANDVKANDVKANDVKANDVKVVPPPPPTPVPTTEAPANWRQESLGGLTFTVPQTWQARPATNSMRLGEFAIGNPADHLNLVLFRFPGGSGGETQANLDRWIGQFEQADHSPSSDKAKIERREQHGLKIATLDLSGNYRPTAMPGQPAQPIDQARLLAAVVELSDGPVFFKMTGPANAVDTIASDWQKVVASLAPAAK